MSEDGSTGTLALSRQQLDTILQGIGDGITVHSRERLLYANAAAARAIGYPFVEDLLAVPIREIFAQFLLMDEHGNPFPLEQLPGRRALAGHAEPEAVICFQRVGSSERRWSIVRAAPIFDNQGNVACAINIFHDITDRKRAELAVEFLAEASRQLAASLDYETILAKLSQLTVPFLADCCIVDVLERDGYLRQVAVAHVDPEQAELVRAFYRPRVGESDPRDPRLQVLESSESILVGDQSIAETNAGHPVVMRSIDFRSYMVVPLLARGRSLGVLTIGVTGSRPAYGPADLALAEDLARRAALAVDNARLYRETKQAIRLRDDLLGFASHDLRTPLTSIKGHAQMLQRRLASEEGPLADQLREGLAIIDTNTSRMRALIDELLDIAHFQAGKPLMLDRQAADLVAIARHLCADYQRMTDRHIVRCEAAVEQLVGVWDAGRLERVLSNFLSNAIKYSPDGGDVIVRIRRDDQPGCSLAVLEVEDHGIGIPKKDMPYLFERFYRATNVSGKIVGTGLGLAGCRMIVQLHGGNIDVHSAEGCGATFRIVLPLSDSAPGAPSNL